MKKTLIALFALAFAFAFGAANAAKHEMPKGDAPKAEAKKADPIAKSLQDMKPDVRWSRWMARDVKCPGRRKTRKSKKEERSEEGRQGQEGRRQKKGRQGPK